jgi:hypothetical protein
VDPNEVQIETFVDMRSEKNLTPLISYISAQRNYDFGLLVTALKNVDQLSNQKEKAIQLKKRSTGGQPRRSVCALDV